MVPAAVNSRRARGPVPTAAVLLCLLLASCTFRPGAPRGATPTPAGRVAPSQAASSVPSATPTAARSGVQPPIVEATGDARRGKEAASVVPAAGTTAAAQEPPPAAPALQPDAAPSGRTRIALAAVLDYDRRHLAVTETITYTNLTGRPLTELRLLAEPNRQPGVFMLTDLRLADGPRIEEYRLQGGNLHVTLPDPLPAGGAVGLVTSFEIDVPARPAPLGYTEGQLNLGDWYLFPPPYHPEQGWLVHEPAAVGEHLVYDLYDFQIDLQLAGATTDLDIAASAPVQLQDGRRRYRLEAARSFALSAGPAYEVLRSTAGSVGVEAFVFPEHRAAGEAALKTAADAVALYERIFVPYPHDTLALVEGRFPDGMEYDGLFFLDQEYFAAYDGTSRNYLSALSAHETAHQWWYGLAGNDQATEPWLDEAWATYSELLFYEEVHPHLVDWWWSYRVNRFEPTGWVDSSIYDFKSFRPYVNAVYLRGAQFLQLLRESLGDQAFFDLARELPASPAGSIVSTEQFMAIASEKAGGPEHLPLDSFFH